MKYTNYTEEDLIRDEFFQRWILDDDSEARDFWEKWLHENPDKKEFIENAAGFIRTISLIENHHPNENEVDALFEDIIQGNNGTKPKGIGNKRLTFDNGRYKFWTVAACVGLLVSVLTFNFIQGSNNFEQVSKTTGNQVTLKLEDGTVRVLNENASKIIMNSRGHKVVDQDRNLLIYDTKAENISKIKYNELVVPNGKKFELKLSDGSHVLLNSGSKLRYPIVFAKGLARTVYLDGEAYFSIEKDSVSSFVVVTEDMGTKVYGTKFNVSSYNNDDNTSAVLVEGSVGVYKPDSDRTEKSRTIVPGERAKIQGGKISVDMVNVIKYVAWTEGKLFFADDKFELILKKLERHFNVVIDNNREDLKNKRFTGTFTKETVDQIFGIFQEHTPFKYSIKKDTITIYQKS